MQMLSTNGHSPNIITLFLKADRQFIQYLTSHLNSMSYRIRAANSVDEAQHLLKAYMPEAIIAAGDFEPINTFFKSVKKHYQSQSGCPLLLLVSDDPVSDASADIVLPSIWLAQINQQLQSVIALRAEHAKLEQLNQKLKEENKELNGRPENQEKSSDEMNFLKNAIVWNVAHELRTPLLQVKSAVALLAEDVGNNTVLVELAMGATTRLETVVKDITLLNDLVNESLESRTFEPVLMREVMDSVLRNLKRSWQHKNEVDRVKVRMPDHLSPAFGDKQRLVIAIQLLVDNALKFSKSSVEVSVKQIRDKIRVTIRDKGIGIPKDKIEHIYDTFYQVDSSITKRYGGMGIGLAIVRFILERHHAQIILETEEGKGSVFSFELDVADVLPKTG